MTDVTLRAAMAERAARAGGVVAREQFRGDLQVDTKQNKNDMVTGADRDAQRQIIATIAQEFPTATLVCEETSRPPGVSDELTFAERVPGTGPAWIVDPIDGTSNYVRGMRFWATSVAAIADGEPVAGATYLPSQEDIYTVGPESVTRNDTLMTVSKRTDPETFAVGLIGWWPSRKSDEYGALFRAANNRFGDTRRLGCMQGVLALVAAGSLEGAFMPSPPHPWDAITGVHLIREAGGRATDIHGERWTHESEGLVVSNDTAHGEFLDLLQAELPV